MTPHGNTSTLFHDHPYQRELEVRVTALGRDERYGPYAELDATLCHPHGGGQKGDRAGLILPEEDAALLGTPQTLSIVDTRKVDGRILHLLGSALEPERAGSLLVAGGKPCRLRLDWDFRYRQMRLHGAAHLLHCFVERTVGAPLPFPETSDLQSDYGLNRYARPDLLSPAQMESAVRQLNAFTAEEHTIITRAEENRPGYRYWECEQWVIPCGGTHVASTQEIGAVEVNLSTKRGRTSMTFRLA